MSQIVQARCPHCKNVLRIPADWLQQPMRCKHCKQVFQAKGKAPVNGFSPAKPVAAGIAAGGPPAAIPSGGAFEFNQSGGPGGRKPYRSGRRGNRWLLPVTGLAVVASIAVALVFFGPQLLELMNPPSEKENENPPTKIAQNGGQPGTGNPKPTNPGEKPSDPPKIKPKTDKNPKPPDVNPKPPVQNPDPPEPGPMTGKPPEVKPDDPGLDPLPKPKPKPKTIYPQEKFPRRALVISVNEYLLANPLNYGENRPPAPPKGQAESYFGSSAKAVLNGFGNFTMKFPNTQLFEVSDAAKGSELPVKPVIENAITKFLATSRGQDRIVLFFSGHIAKDDKDNAYLVPIEGDLDDAKTLIPITWVFDELKKSPATQKVLILDVCRFYPSKGALRAGGDPLDEMIEKKLQSPPAGVQVWVACSKEQQSLENSRGSLFQEALCSVAWEKPAPIYYPHESLPIEDMVKKVNEYLKTHSSEKTQVSQLYGKEPAEGTPFDPDEPPAAKFNLAPAGPGSGAAGKAQVANILKELKAIPPVRAGKVEYGPKGEVLQSGTFSAALEKLLEEYPFPAKAIAEYKVDGYADEKEFLTQEKEFPIRAYVVRAKDKMQKITMTFKVKDSFPAPFDAKFKAKVKDEQVAPAKAEFDLKSALEELEEAKQYIKEEPSKRWKAHYYFTVAILKARLIYITEYNTILGQIRLESLPELPKGMNAYEVASSDKLSTPKAGSTVHDWKKQLKKDWVKVIDDFPETPWALLARREKDAALGLEWRPSKK